MSSRRGAAGRVSMRVSLYGSEATGQAVMGKALSLPWFPPPLASLQWPSLSFPSITQPIKEGELGVRLNSQHTEKHTHMRSVTYLNYECEVNQSKRLHGAGLKLNKTLSCSNWLQTTVCECGPDATRPHTAHTRKAPSLMSLADCCSQLK